MSAVQLLYVAIGGALGAVSRALISHWMRGGFPWGTFTVNVLGSLIIGIVLGWMGAKTNAPHALRFLFATGFCGAFTTFSTFSYETLAMLDQQRWAAGLGNIALNVMLCLAATWVGIRLAIAIATT
ncbi:fluoride efflux transporter CrcB [Cerasicoccus arenae]|uniref:Fluoride-specific ion channel FluC n=1 Tax=Cerasicoccus arenae TaxID=424488 RepID=A0A8J3GEJ4_9BACT|nr:fluoride efflux transporter CrcB [Cerasicoccus arenae]MBK1858963.1 fluoride efflux transporter CrcB [Cerasicoccus arenae]GHC04121.1 putative fluoride ion transporter CrcB [Cerasicoccus arenae]